MTREPTTAADYSAREARDARNASVYADVSEAQMAWEDRG